MTAELDTEGPEYLHSSGKLPLPPDMLRTRRRIRKVESRKARKEASARRVLPSLVEPRWWMVALYWWHWREPTGMDTGMCHLGTYKVWNEGLMTYSKEQPLSWDIPDKEANIWIRTSASIYYPETTENRFKDGNFHPRPLKSHFCLVKLSHPLWLGA